MSEMAADVYTLEEIEAPPAKTWGSAAIAWLFALFTLGGGTTPIVGPGVRVLGRDGTLLAEIENGYELVSADLTQLSAEDFAARWISGPPS
ncbi:MAG: hypothetical protein AAGA90_14240 [Actinomycetota bacterium]